MFQSVIDTVARDLKLQLGQPRPGNEVDQIFQYVDFFGDGFEQ
jgi:hypothetical protein